MNKNKSSKFVYIATLIFYILAFLKLKSRNLPITSTNWIAFILCSAIIFIAIIVVEIIKYKKKIK